ncbi:endonuclease/exonuclease/phosphatase family protein [Auraticoccus sp. F435]|uniref:Endonuclease/exonuclease/phosphatase family protein n=1 Tax=Auraticoccus cholistanensis TaxID=2656650 RepID=A0A6A9USM6_9ACTN|nr:endonuclease/exonuclease/phosphatase family protein [Auraticoccus cholistanensis]MVA74725.1 endonuclease/exonuclease/phosphatase family protein [Auraticoccus cholistanensis]
MRNRSPRRSLAVATATVLGAAALAPALAPPAGAAPATDVRVATFNASLNRATEGELVADLSTPDDPQARAVAEIVQRTRPDVLVVQEFDHDAEGRAVRLFAENYLGRSQAGAAPVEYPYSFSAPVNTGVPSGFDLNGDGTVGGPDDAWGFGAFPGQYGMVVYSRHPIALEDVRTFQHFRWADMPGALLPDDPATPEPADFYSPEELARLPLSSKSHWDVPVRVGGRTVHLLTSHPTPPVFDGPEDRNGRRNSDEIRFWADYVSGLAASRHVYDDQGRRGGLRAGAAFVVAGDLNSDPRDGDSLPGSIDQLLEHPRVGTGRPPASEGAVEASRLQGGVNDDHRSPAAHDTADFAEPPGNIRADYVLPSRQLRVRDSGVFWPRSDDPLSRLTGTFPFPSSDHRLVWVDLRVPGGPAA